MDTQTVIAILIAVTAFAAVINYRYLQLPKSIGFTLITLVCSSLLILLDQAGIKTAGYTNVLLNSLHFNETFMGGMISFLLFAGGLHINAIELAEHKLTIGLLATISVIISTFVTGVGIWIVAHMFNTNIDLIYALVFGAIIAPTDPIAVLGLLKRVKAPKSLEMKVAGESLFNDGISIVLFIALLEFAEGSGSFSSLTILMMFLQQLIGGLLFGFILGFVVNLLLRKIDDFEVSILLTLSVATGGYLLATQLGISGPIAMVIAGLLVGWRLNHCGLAIKSAEFLQIFWKMIDQTLNAILFVLIGIVVLHLTFTTNTCLVACFAIPIMLLARYVSVLIPIKLIARYRSYHRHAIKVLTWGGLRGGISIALALGLPDVAAKDEILLATYAIVLFSLLVQGLTIQPLFKRLFPTDDTKELTSDLGIEVQHEMLR